MSWVKCQACKREADKAQTWYVCDNCGFRVCDSCISIHTGEYNRCAGAKCSQCIDGILRIPNGQS